MKTAIKVMVLVLVTFLTSCVADPIEEIKVDTNTLTQESDPGDDDDVDCKSNECG